MFSFSRQIEKGVFLCSSSRVREAPLLRRMSASFSWIASFLAYSISTSELLIPYWL